MKMMNLQILFTEQLQTLQNNYLIKTANKKSLSQVIFLILFKILIVH
jgi:hypothetical protein